MHQPATATVDRSAGGGVSVWSEDNGVDGSTSVDSDKFTDASHLLTAMSPIAKSVEVASPSVI